jgi:predicted AAA+ superfamily ATPase
VADAGELPRLLRYLAAKTAQELRKTNLANEIGIERHAVAAYLPLLETVFLVRQLPAWSRNPLGKVTRTPKVHVTDTGLAAHLLGVTPQSLAKPLSALRGPLVETFVHNELVRQSAWAEQEVALSHWRDRAGAEVDLVVESADGTVFGIESKASSTVTGEDFRWLRRLADRLGSDFGGGIVFYLGAEGLSFGPKLTALPLAALWA